MITKTIAMLLFILMLFIAWTFSPPPLVAANGTTFEVDSTDDELDLDNTDGICLSIAGTCTLWAAIQQANKDPVAVNTIAFNIPIVLTYIYISNALPTIYTPMHTQGPNLHNGG